MIGRPLRGCLGGYLLACLAVLVAAGPLRGQGDGGADPTVILHGGRILSGPDFRGDATAVALRGATILAVGSDREVLERRGPGTRVVDLGGRVVLPGLKDHHVHLSGSGFALLNRDPATSTALDLSGLSPEEIAARVRERTREVPAGTWILGRGWSHLGWGPDTLPKHTLLTTAAPSHPVFLGDSDAHVGWVNLEALHRAGIDAGTPHPPGGRFFRYPDGRPTGVLLERAVEPVLRLVPPVSDVRIRQAFRAAAEAQAALGVTEVYDATFIGPDGVANSTTDFGRYLRLLAAEDRARPLPLRVNVMMMTPSPFADTLLADPDAWRAPSPRVRVTHIKMFSDGAFARRGAHLTHPFPVEDPDTTTFGQPRASPEELYEYAVRALDGGLDVATHAIGDAAVRRVLDVYEAVLETRPDLDPRRLRIEHFSYALPADYERAGRLGVVLAVQPNFITPFYERYVGRERGAQVFALRDHVDGGTPLAGSTDSYGVPRGVWRSYYDAVTRKDRSGRAWHPDQVLSRREALELFTSLHPPGGGAAIPGTVAAGEPADLVVVSGNPLTLSEEEVSDIRTHATILEGEVVHDDGTLGGLSP